MVFSKILYFATEQEKQAFENKDSVIRASIKPVIDAEVVEIKAKEEALNPKPIVEEVVVEEGK